MIISVNVNAILNHENNPRKDMGDLSELTQSIKKNGVLQPLTIVPYKGMYKAVIGHRRLEAAKQAGLEEVPCEVRDLSESEQLNVMMMENMMREALTTYEEAKGFQMMLDLGKSVEEVSDETGFSPTTIRKRTKLLGLDEKKFKESVQRGATLDDLLKLDKIEDTVTRNAVLATAGTPDFNSKLNSALDTERRTRKLIEAEQEIGKYAKLIENRADITTPIKYVTCVNSTKGVPVPIDGVQYYYTKNDYTITVYMDGDPDEIAENKRREEEQRMIREYLRDRCLSAYNLRTTFIKNFGNFRKYGKAITKAYIEASIEDASRTSWRSFDISLLDTMLGVEDAKAHLEDFAPEKVMLCMISLYHDSPSASSWNDAWNGTEYVHRYEQNDKLLKFYQFLMSIGYQPSKEEINFCNGDIDYVVKVAAA